jgi:hypothetical protein
LKHRVTILTIVGALVGIAGGLGTLIGLKYGYDQIKLVRKQIELMQQDIKDRKEQEAEDDTWAFRFEELGSKLCRINPSLQVREPGNQNTTWVYATMYPDPKFRIDVETFIVKADSATTVFLPRSPQPHEFRSPRMRETIAKSEALMEQFIKEHPFCRQHLYG